MKSIFIFIFLISNLCFAQSSISKNFHGHLFLDKILPTQFQAKKVENFEVVRPFAEYEHASFVFMSADLAEETNGEVEEMKKAIVQKTPSDVTVVIYGSNKKELDAAKAMFNPLRDPAKIKFVLWSEWDGSKTFWARDALPVAAFGKQGNLNVNGLVGGQYPESFRPNQKISDLLKYPLVEHQEAVDHGTFSADTQGNCFVGEAWAPSEKTLGTSYGCKTVSVVPDVGGIGHFDEHSKFISDKVALTDSVEHANIFKSYGMKSVMLPKATGYRFYSNALMINGVAFVPVFDLPQDQEAIDAYRSVGLEVIPLKSRYTSDNLAGSIHCFTMIYP